MRRWGGCGDVYLVLLFLYFECVVGTVAWVVVA